MSVGVMREEMIKGIRGEVIIGRGGLEERNCKVMIFIFFIKVVKVLEIVQVFKVIKEIKKLKTFKEIIKEIFMKIFTKMKRC